MKFPSQQLIDETRESVLANEGQALELFASYLHVFWRGVWVRRNMSPSAPCLKTGSNGEQVDINVPFAELDPIWRREYEEAVKAILSAIKQFPKDKEAAAAYVHQEWMKRNAKEGSDASLHVPYEALPQEEKERNKAYCREIQRLLDVKIQRTLLPFA